jgi:thioredoxin-like negative regulator of GroEL
MSIPTVVLFKGGQEVSRQTGFSGKEAYIELILKGGDI